MSINWDSWFRTALANRSLPLRPTRASEPELMDLPGQDPAILLDCLGDLHLVNRWLGGTWLTMRALESLTGDLPPGADLAIVDLATGGADIPRAMATWAERRGLRARVLATDLNPEILSLAACGIPATIEFAVADARRLPFPDRSFDVETCSLALPHLDPDDAVLMLGEMRRVARRGVIVNDLIRSWLGYWGAWLISRALSDNPLFRHDAPLSVRRAYTRSEMAALAARTGLGPIRFHGFLGYRVAMVAGGPP